MATTNCHQCRHHHPLVEIVSCKVRGCPMNYGVGCVVKNYPPYEEECRAIGTSTWKCPRCRGICGCTVCQNFDDGKRRRYMNDEVILPIMSDSFVEAEAFKQKEQDFNATISSLKASLANEEAQKLEAKEARKVIEKELHSVREVFQRVLASPKVKFTAEEPLRSIMGHKLRRIMDYKHNIRNITVIAQASQGKSSLTDALVAATAAGIIAQDTAGDVRMTDTGISLYHHMTDEALKSFKGERNGNNYVINLIDSPAALCITDGALVVVDCIEGVCVQTETVLHQALVERVRPVLTVNNMDRCFLELQVDGERAYHIFSRVIKTVNVIMATYKDPLCGDVMVYPEKGTVAFSSGLHGWSFTLTNFAKMYAGKFGVDESKMMERLWGDNFFDPKTKKWTKEDTGAATCKRGFVQFCYDPIKHIINTCMNDEQDVLWPLLANLGVTMKSEEKELMGKPLMKRVMQNWLPAATALLEMVIFHLPSPHTAQRYRVENLYDGPLDDPYANAIKNCDRDGPVMLHVSKMIPAASGRFFAFGRVFAGTVSAGMKVRIRGPNFVPGEKKDLLYLYVKSVAIWMGKKQETVEDVPCGNTLSIMLSVIKEEEKSGGENLIAGLCLKDLEEDLMGGVKSDPAVSLCETVGLSVENKFVDLQDKLCGIQARLLKRRSFEDDEVIMPSTSDSFVEAEALKQKVQELNATISNLETTISSLKASLANEEAQKLEAKEARKVIEKELHSVREVFQRVLASPKVKFTAEEPLRKLRRIMDNKHNIRNITVIAHVDHGKSTLTDSLVAAAAAVGIIAQETAGDVRMTDTGISLYYQITDEALKSFKGERNGDDYLINLIDFSSSALRITDGALVVVDCIEGVCVQTKTVLRQALGERIRPVLIIDKMDKCFLELKVDGEEAYQTFQKIIENFNLLMASYKDPVLGDSMVYPKKGTVVFSSGSHGWAFTLTNFAKMYAGKFGVDESKMMERLWGENFFDPKTKKWTKQNTGAATCKRGFVQLCYEPIQRIIDFCMNGKKDVLWLWLAKFGVTMKSEDKELMGKLLMKRVMQNWLPAAMALLELMIFHLPSPDAAQRYRVDNLYQGPLDDAYANAIRNCDPNGPMVLYVSKMIPAYDKGRFFAFGRVFAGKVSTGMKVRIMGPNYVHGEKKDLYVKSVQRTVIWMGKKQETVEDVPCGNTVAITVEGSGENIIAGLCFEDLEEDFMGGAPIVESDLAVKGR